MTGGIGTGFMETLTKKKRGYFMKMPKIFKSKVFWFNIVSGCLEIINQSNGSIVPVQYSATIIMVGNIVLRYLTTKPVSEK